MRKRKMDDLAIEITELGEKIKDAEKKNRKEKIRFKLGKISAIAKLTTAFTIIPLAGTLVSFAAGWNPFKLNDIETPKTITTTIDGDGEENIQEEYKDENTSLTLTYYTKWIKNDDGKFYRYKYVYDLIDDSDIQEIVSLMKSKKEISMEDIEELINSKILDKKNRKTLYTSCETETKTKIDETKVNKGHLEITKVDVDKLDFLLEKESMREHIANFLSVLSFVIISMYFEICILKKLEFFEKQDDAIYDYPYLINVNDLQKQLDEKQQLFYESEFECSKEDIISYLDDSTTEVQEDSIQFMKRQRLQ